MEKEGKSYSEKMDEHENAAFKYMYESFSVLEKLDVVLKQRNIDQYFIICREMNVPPKEEVINAFPSKYLFHFQDYTPASQEKSNLVEDNNLRLGIRNTDKHSNGYVKPNKNLAEFYSSKILKRLENKIKNN